MNLDRLQVLPGERNARNPIDPGVRIGHVHLKVADLDRALGFYCGVLGFELKRATARRRLSSRGRLSSPYRSQHLGEPGARRRPAGTTGLYHVAILYPNRAALADALLTGSYEPVPASTALPITA